MRIGNAPGATSRWSRSIRCRSLRLMEPLVDIVGVAVVAEYRLRLTFEDGTVGEVDFNAREWRGVFEPLQDPGFFARVAVDPESGTISWPNGVDMAPEPLYESASRNRAPVSARG
jgi:Protein of unknown function (DUF2442)